MKSAKLVSGLLLGLTLLASPAFAQRDVQRLNTEGIARAIGKQGDLTGEMYKVSFPRSDLTVNVGNVAIKPALALMAWAAFIKSGNNAVTYGDLVVLEEEVNPVISKLEERGLELSALHNHLLHETPRVMYIHFVGRGDEVELAKGGVGAHQEPVGRDGTSSGDQTRNRDRDRKDRWLPRHDGGRRVPHHRAEERPPRGVDGHDDSRQHGHEHPV